MSLAIKTVALVVEGLHGTRRLYYEDQYMKEFDASVVDAWSKDDKTCIVLDQTCFYPGGGGQPCDTGVLVGDGWRLVVETTYLDSDRIVHEGVLEGRMPKIGEIVHGVLDWDRRYRLMRMHTAAHIIGCVVKKLFNARFAGGAIGVDYSYDDYTARIKRSDLPRIEDEANKIVEAGLRHIVRVMDRDEAEKYLERFGERLTELHEGLEKIRILEIEGICAFPCGGTHVANTSEVGRIKLLKRESKGRGITRIRYTIEP